MLIPADWTLTETLMLGNVNPHKMEIYTNPNRPNDRLEIVSHPNHPTVWAYRTPREAAGTGLRPVGGTSEKSMRKFLRG